MDERLFALARGFGVAVEYADLGPDRDGEYLHHRRLIRLQHGMSTRLHRSVLAHECAHARFGDTPTRDPFRHARQERRADEWGATQLIRPLSYRRAERLHGGHRGAIAVELEVTTDLVAAFQRVLARAPHEARAHDRTA